MPSVFGCGDIRAGRARRKLGDAAVCEAVSFTDVDLAALGDDDHRSRDARFSASGGSGCTGRLSLPHSLRRPSARHGFLRTCRPPPARVGLKGAECRPGFRAEIPVRAVAGSSYPSDKKQLLQARTSLPSEPSSSRRLPSGASAGVSSPMLPLQNPVAIVEEGQTGTSSIRPRPATFIDAAVPQSSSVPRPRRFRHSSPRARPCTAPARRPPGRVDAAPIPRLCSLHR